MTLIVILNAVLALGIVGVIVALHARAIVVDHRRHEGSVKLSMWPALPPRTIQATERAQPRERSLPRRTPAALAE